MSIRVNDFWLKVITMEVESNGSVSLEVRANPDTLDWLVRNGRSMVVSENGGYYINVFWKDITAIDKEQ